MSANADGGLRRPINGGELRVERLGGNAVVFEQRHRRFAATMSLNVAMTPMPAQHSTKVAREARQPFRGATDKAASP